MQMHVGKAKINQTAAYALPKLRMRTIVRRRHFLSLSTAKLHSNDHTLAHLSETHNSGTNFIPDARQLFDELPQRNVVSASTLISQLARNSYYREAIIIFTRMLEFNIRPSEHTFSSLIHSSTAMKDLVLGKQFHGSATKAGLQSRVFVGSALLDLYAKFSTIEEAQLCFEETLDPNVVSYTALVCGYIKRERFDEAVEIFRTMPERNIVSWNAMIGGYSQAGHNEEAVNLFIGMLREGLVPNQSTFPCVISSAANIAALGMGKSFHAYAVKSLEKIGVFVGNSLISFYAKCGSMEDSLLLFNRIHERNIVSWNALICGYAQNGKGREAIEVFHEMQGATDLEPNSVTLLGVLLACNHVGLVDEGYSYFNQARLKNPSLLMPEHYACMVDLFSRSGRFKEAEKFICDLPFDPGIGFWKALLGGCQIHSNKELGEFSARKILALDPGDVSSYVMLSNAHSAAGRWQSVSRIRNEMREKGMRRIPGCSWIEIQSKVHVFVTGDSRHDQTNNIYMVLRSFIDHASGNARDPNFMGPGLPS